MDISYPNLVLEKAIKYVRDGRKMELFGERVL